MLVTKEISLCIDKPKPWKFMGELSTRCMDNEIKELVSEGRKNGNQVIFQHMKWDVRY